MQKLTQRDIRTLKIGGICVAAIVIFVFGTTWIERWSKVRADIQKKEAELDLIDRAKQTGVMSIVPAFETPEKEEDQKNRFRTKLVEQLNKAGIKTEPLKVVTTKKTLLKNYKLMLIQCKAKCSFTQALDFLARLNENPHLVGVEEFRIKCDQNKPQEVELDITVSTAYAS
jgi:hypothetical protein